MHIVIECAALQILRKILLMDSLFQGMHRVP